MRTSTRTLALAAAAATVTAALALAACTPRGDPGRPMARVALGLRHAAAQLPAVTRLALAVTGADMAAVTADLPLDGASLTLSIPAGQNRLFTLDAYAGPVRTHTGSRLVPSLEPGPPVTVTIQLAPVGAPTLVSIAVSPAAASVAVGATQAFSATGTWSDGSSTGLDGQVTWASSAPAVATISAAGLATGQGPGSAGIAAASGGVTSGAAVLTVTGGGGGATGPSRWLVYHRFANPGQVAAVAAAREDGGARVTLAAAPVGGDVRYAGVSAGRVLFTRAEPGGLAGVWSVKPDGSGEVLLHQGTSADAVVAAPLGETLVVREGSALFLARVDGGAPSSSLGSGGGCSQAFRSDGRTTLPDGQAEGRFWFQPSDDRTGIWSIGPGEAAATQVTPEWGELVAVLDTPLGRRVFFANLDGRIVVAEPNGQPGLTLASDFDGAPIDNGPPLMGITRPIPHLLVLVGDRVVYPADDGVGGKYLAAVGLDGGGHEVVSPVGPALHLLGGDTGQVFAALEGAGTYEPVACDVPSPGFASCSRSFYTGQRAGAVGGWGLIANGAELAAVPFSDGMSTTLTSRFTADLWGDGSQATSPWALDAGGLLVHAIDYGGDQDLVAALPDGTGRFDLGVSGWNEALAGLSGARAVYARDVNGQHDLASSVVDQRLGAGQDQRPLSLDPADERVVALHEGTVFFTRAAPGGAWDFHAVLDDGTRHARLTDEPGVVKGFAGLATFEGPVLPPRLDTVAVTCGATELFVGEATSCSAAGTLTDGGVAVLSGLTWSVVTDPAAPVISVDATGHVVALSTSDAWLVASVDGEPWAWVSIVVWPAASLTSIAVSPSPASVAPGGTLQLAATGDYSDGSSADLTAAVTWLSSAPGVATVDPGGLATGHTAGVASLTATFDGVTSAPVLLTVTGGVVLTGLSVSPASASLAVGATVQLTATGGYSDGSAADLTTQATWASSSPAVASVSAAGLATGLAPGGTTITAAFDGLNSPGAALTVTAPAVVPLVAIPRTGALASAAAGDDGWWRVGQAWPATRFTDPEGGPATGATALDRLTGLEWPLDAAGTLDSVPCAGAPASRTSGFTWPEAAALVACANTAAYLGRTDWRLPNAFELMSLGDTSTSATPPGGQPFQLVADRGYWSGSTAATNPGGGADVAWTFRFTASSGGWRFRTDRFYFVWLVRGGVAGPGVDPAWPVNLQRTGQVASLVAGDEGAAPRGVERPAVRFVTGYGVGASATQPCGLVDTMTGLQWSGAGSDTWRSSLDFIHLFAHCGAADWRMPTVAELRTLLDFSSSSSIPYLAAQGLPMAQFPAALDAGVWSSTGDPRYPGNQAFPQVVVFKNNGVGPTRSDLTRAAFMVRSPGRTVTRITTASLAVSPAGVTLAPAGTAQLTATATLSDGSAVEATAASTWASSALAVATVDLTGLATGVAAGSAGVTATLDGVTSAPALVTVVAPPSLLVGEAFKVVLAGGHAYVAGYWNDGTKDIPCVWIDGARLDVAGDGVHSARAAAVAVEGGVVYLGGYWSNGVRLVPAVWTGALRIDLAGDGVNDASVNAISVAGGVATAGGYWKDAAQGHPALWTLAPGQAAVRTDLPGDLLAGVRDDPMVLRVVQQSGHTYATGWVRDGFYSRATLWVDGARTILPDLVWSYGIGLAVDAGTTYVAGNVYDGGKYLASLWTNGARTDLAHDGVHDATYMAAAVSGGQLVLGGAVHDGTSYLPSTWVNGVRTTLPGTTTVRGDYPVADVAADAGTIHAVGHTSDAAGSHPAHWVGTTRGELGAPALLSLAVSPASGLVPQGAALQLTATATYAGGVTVDVTRFATWASAAQATVAVDAAGLATGVASGSTNVTATVAGVTSAPATLTVGAPFAGHATSVARAGGKTYVSGWWSDGARRIPAYWVDGVRHDLAGDGLHDADASRIAVDGGVVHVSGSWTDGAGLVHAAVWSDGVRTDLPIRAPGFKAYATDVTAAGGTVHLSGSTFDGAGGLPCTWSGSAVGGYVRTDLPGDVSAGIPADATANAVAVEGGTVYAAGWVRNGFYATPSVFVGSVREGLPLPNGDLGGYWGFPTGIRVVGGVPYVGVVQSTRAAHYVAALYVGPPATAVRTQFEGDGVHDSMASGLDVAGGVVYLSGAWSDGALAHPSYWDGPTRVDLPGTVPLPAGGLPWPTGGIAVDAGRVYVAGSLSNGAGSVKPVLWADGVATDLR